jgi:RimJ/RimL family protein N-acetyltransferase
MPPSTSTSPWQSARLYYRAVRPTDTPLFQALAADPAVHLASTHETTKLPTAQDIEENMNQSTGSSSSSSGGGSGPPDHEQSLLAAIIWLPHPPSLSSLPLSERAKALEEKQAQSLAPEHVDVHFGTAIGHIHSAPTTLHERHHRTMEIALDILPAYQGKGYGSEAVNWALEFGFRRAGLHSVRLRAFGWNKGAIRLYERLGFVMEGREREAVWYEGEWWDSVTLGMLEDEWRAREKK